VHGLREAGYHTGLVGKCQLKSLPTGFDTRSCSRGTASTGAPTCSATVLDFLDDQKLAQHTIVVYTSDNGFFLGEHGPYDKRLMHEPSIGVPLLVRYPASHGGTALSPVPSRYRPSADTGFAPCRSIVRLNAATSVAIT
jgi:arylsulfatase A-like enzyme